MSAHNTSKQSPFAKAGGIWNGLAHLAGYLSPNGEKQGAGDESLRAAKRRRVDEVSRDANVVAAVGPLFKDPAEQFTRALRVEALRIRRDCLADSDANGLLKGNGSPLKKDLPVAVIRSRCRLTVSTYRSHAAPRLMYCESQPCELRVFRELDDSYSMARVRLRQPFQIDAEQLYIERDDLSGLRLADQYLITIEFESAGDGKWPPMDLLSSHKRSVASSASARQWVLSSRSIYSCAEGRRGRETTRLHLRKDTGEEITTDLIVDTDLRWSTTANQEKPALKEHITQRLDEKPLGSVLLPLTNGHINGRAENLVNGQIHEDSDEDDDAGDDEGEGEAVTPSRSLRMRDKPHNYNLKLLSDKARGKESKERKKRKDARNGDSVEVTYLLPHDHRLQVKNWLCIKCFTAHDILAQLEEHLSQHSDWQFTTEHKPNEGWCITVSLPGQGVVHPDDVGNLVEPSTANGDGYDSGRDSRVGVVRGPAKSIEASGGLASQHQRPAKQKIPDNGQPMYDRLSKAVLKPLSEVDEPNIDNSWQLQKHRDVIRDYTDVHADEKEYITVWDAFAQTRRASNGPFFRDIYLEFLEEKAAWLAASQNRMNEVFKHMFYLNARDTLDKSTVSKCVSILRDARTQSHGSPSQIENDPPKSDMGKATFGCAVCGQLQGPDQLICANLECEQPYHHKACVQEQAKIPVDRRDWKCNKCCRMMGV